MNIFIYFPDLDVWTPLVRAVSFSKVFEPSFKQSEKIFNTAQTKMESNRGRGGRGGRGGRSGRPESPDVQLSKALSWLLRHGAQKGTFFVRNHKFSMLPATPTQRSC